MTAQISRATFEGLNLTGKFIAQPCLFDKISLKIYHEKDFFTNIIDINKIVRFLTLSFDLGDGND